MDGPVESFFFGLAIALLAFVMFVLPLGCRQAWESRDAPPLTLRIWWSKFLETMNLYGNPIRIWREERYNTQFRDAFWSLVLLLIPLTGAAGVLLGLGIAFGFIKR